MMRVRASRPFEEYHEEQMRHTIEWFRDHWEKIEAAARFGPGVSAAVREMVGAV